MIKVKDIKTEFKPYRSFINEEQLNEFIDLLKQSNIEYKIRDNETIITKVIVGSPMKPKFKLLVKLEDFEKIDKLVLENPISIEEIENHYLNQLDNQELHDILLNSKEWSIEAVQTAEIILKSRDFDINYQEIEDSKKVEVLNDVKGKKEPIYKVLIYALCLVAGFMYHFIFALAGLAMGYYYAFGKKYNQMGEKYYVYDKQTRILGKLLLIGGVLVLLVQFFILIRYDTYF